MDSSGCDNLVCEICDVKCYSLKDLDIHYNQRTHTSRSNDLARYVFGFVPDKQITCLSDLFNHPSKRGAFIGLQYVKETSTEFGKPLFACILCNVVNTSICQHIAGIKHKRKYIEKDFSFIFDVAASIPLKTITQIATIIEKAEGLQKFKASMKNLTKKSKASDCYSSRTLNKIVEQLRIHGIPFKNPFVNEKDESCHKLGGFKARKPTQPVRKPIMSLSRPVLGPFSHPSLGASAGKNLKSHDSRKATKRSFTSDISPIKDMASKRMPSFSQHQHALGTMSGSISSLTGPTYSVPPLKQHTTSHYGYSSVDIKELSSDSLSSPLGVISLLHKKPSLPKSHGGSPPSEGLSPTTSSQAQTSQSTYSDTPVKAASVLSPHTLKILQGRDPESVKSILKRLSEYCSELQQVNISLLVDVLFEIGALP